MTARKTIMPDDKESSKYPTPEDSPSIPPYAITIMQPYAALIAYGGKDIENRGPGVAGTIGNLDYRGPIALTCSKAIDIDGRRRPLCLKSGKMPDDVALYIQYTMDNWAHLARWNSPPRPTLELMQQMAGTWFATARLAAVFPAMAHGHGWQVADQYGLSLQEIDVFTERIPSTGGRGFFAFARCATCARPMPKDALTMHTIHRCPNGAR